MSEVKPFLFKSIASIVDQALLSGLNFLIGLALMRLASKETYGIYSQLFGVGLLVTSLLGALIASALVALAVRLPPAEQFRMIARSFRLQLAAALVCAVASGVGVYLLALRSQFDEEPVALALAFAAYVFTLSCREFCRTSFFIASQAERVTVVDLAFVLFTVAGGGLLYALGRVTVTDIFWLTAASNGLSALVRSRALWGGAKAAPEDYREDMGRLWRLSRWALVGAVVGWGLNNGYLYFAGGLLGSAELADLNAARLLLIPIAIVMIGWARVAEPRLGQMIHLGQWQRIWRFMGYSTLVLELFVAAYSSALMLLFPWLSSHLLGPKYSHVAGLMLLWSGYFAINAARMVGTTMLGIFGAFKATFWQGLSMIPLMVLVCLMAIPRFGVAGVLGAMIVVEAVLLAMNWMVLMPRAREGHLATVK